jgi:hypothetical protein
MRKTDKSPFQPDVVLPSNNDSKPCSGLLAFSSSADVVLDIRQDVIHNIETAANAIRNRVDMSKAPQRSWQASPSDKNRRSENRESISFAQAYCDMHMSQRKGSGNVAFANPTLPTRTKLYGQNRNAT